MSRILESIISTSLVPIIALNLFGEIVGAIWLLALGEWKLVIFAFLASVFFPFVYSFILLIQVPLAALLSYLVDKKKRALSVITGFISGIITHALSLVWVFLVFMYMLTYSEGENSLPYLLYGYGTATGPFSYMASKEEPDSIGTYVAVYLTQIAYLILATSFYLGITQFALPLIILITIGIEILVIRFVLKAAFPK